MKTLLALLVVTLTGCNTVAGMMPTMDNCDEVVYVRKGADVEMHLKCTAPK